MFPSCVSPAAADLLLVRQRARTKSDCALLARSGRCPLELPGRYTQRITIFSGGFPLYRNGVLIGAIGISGDGGDQDDIVGASGTHDFLAPDSIRADQFVYKGARPPYAKFPRDPNGANGVNEVVTQPCIHRNIRQHVDARRNC